MSRAERQRRTVIIMVAALAVIVVAAAAVVFWPDTALEEQTPLVSLDTGLVDRFAVEHGDTALTFEKQDDGGWVCAEHPVFPVGGSYIDSIVEGFTAITASRELTVEQSAELDIGSQTLKLTVWLGESSRDITFYSLNGQTLSYYTKVNGGKTVYTVSNTQAEAFMFGLYDVAELENSAAVLSTELNSLEVALPSGETLTLYYQAAGRPELDYTSQAVWFYSLNGGELRPADAIAATAVFDAFQNIANERLASYNITQSQLEDYSLTDGYIRVAMQYVPRDSEQTVTVVRRFANLLGGEMTPAYTEGSTNAYFVDSSMILTLLDAMDADLEPHETLGIEIDDIIGFTVNRGEYTAQYTIEHSEDTEGNAVYSIYRGGEKVESASFVKLFYGLKAIVPQSVVDSQGNGSQLFSITFYTENESYGGITMTVREYDNSFYVSTVAHDSPLLLNRRSVDLLLEYLNDL